MVAVIGAGSRGAGTATWGEILDKRVVGGRPWVRKDHERVDGGTVISLSSLVDMPMDWHDVHGFEEDTVIGIEGGEWVGVVIDGVEDVREVSGGHGYLILLLINLKVGVE